MSTRTAFRWMSTIMLSLVMLLLCGCSESPAGVANKFVAAGKAHKTVEATGYLAQPELSNTSPSSLVDGSFRPDFKTEQSGGDSARVISASNPKSYMMLKKTSNGWRITEVGFTRAAQEEEEVPQSETTEESSDMWDGETELVSDGSPGRDEVTYAVSYVNGSEIDRSETSRSRVTEPTSKVTRVGTKSRATEKWLGPWGAFELRAKRISWRGEPGEGGLIVDLDVRNRGKETPDFVGLVAEDFAYLTGPYSGGSNYYYCARADREDQPVPGPGQTVEWTGCEVSYSFASEGPKNVLVQLRPNVYQQWPNSPEIRLSEGWRGPVYDSE